MKHISEGEFYKTKKKENIPCRISINRFPEQISTLCWDTIFNFILKTIQSHILSANKPFEWQCLRNNFEIIFVTNFISNI